MRSDEITSEMGTDMIVDCDRCEVRGDACGECVITVLLGAPPEGLELDGADRRALDTLAAAGMVPRLQLVECCDEDHDDRRAADGGSDAAGRNRAERSVGDVQRSERRVG
ncbi:MAG: hypothetical protein ACRDRV_16060 [Pseudonocardiaceae bacterium]